MTKKEILNVEELDQVSGGANPEKQGLQHGPIEVHCSQCGHVMHLVKIENGPHGESIRTFRCDVCGHVYKH